MSSALHGPTPRIGHKGCCSFSGARRPLLLLYSSDSLIRTSRSYCIDSVCVRGRSLAPRDRGESTGGFYSVFLMNPPKFTFSLSYAVHYVVPELAEAGVDQEVDGDCVAAGREARGLIIPWRIFGAVHPNPLLYQILFH